MKMELAAYILELNDASKNTHQAEDRRLYDKYLASAAVILALTERGAESETIKNEIQAHERLWGNTWLVDDAYKKPSNAWQKVLEAQ